MTVGPPRLAICSRQVAVADRALAARGAAEEQDRRRRRRARRQVGDDVQGVPPVASVEPLGARGRRGRRREEEGQDKDEEKSADGATAERARQGEGR